MEHTYRGKSIFNGDWIYGSFLPTISSETRKILSENILNEQGNSQLYITPIQKGTLCRCTGFKALKPIKRIKMPSGVYLLSEEKRKMQWLYEGDIVRWAFHNKWLFVVEWNDEINGFCFNNLEYKTSFAFYDKSKCEIIGNKFDNPKLLKEMEQYHGI